MKEEEVKEVITVIILPPRRVLRIFSWQDTRFVFGDDSQPHEIVVKLTSNLWWSLLKKMLYAGKSIERSSFKVKKVKKVN